MSPRHRVFARMWGVAVVAHLAGNWRYGDVWPEPSAIGMLLAVTGLVGTIAMVAPRHSVLLLLGVLVPATAVLEAPVLSNHWLLAAFVSAAYLLTWGDYERFEPAIRVILLVFYGFAAFAKLNTGFLDPTTSCGLFYANQSLGEIGLGPISASSWFGWVVSWGSALVEVAIPVLLLFRRTRAVGALAGILFHGLLTFDLAQHFYDFTGVLLPLFALFLSDRFFDRFESVGESIRPRSKNLVVGLIAVLGVAVTTANVTPLNSTTVGLLTHGSFVWWIPYLAVIVWAAVGAVQPVSLRWRLGPAAMVLVGLVFLNGLTPYLELKTAYGWNMYSNLVVVDGDSNHIIVRSSVPLREGHQHLVEIVSSDDPGLQIYADENYLLPWPSFRSYAADNPDVAVTFRRAGRTVEVERARNNPFLSEPTPWWWRWLPLRAIHEQTPDRCQPVFLPAL